MSVYDGASVPEQEECEPKAILPAINHLIKGVCADHKSADTDHHSHEGGNQKAECVNILVFLDRIPFVVLDCSAAHD